MFTIGKRFEFAASHQLSGLRTGHPCSRLHGHNYVVEVELCAQDVDQLGMVRDYGDLSVVKELLDERYDHRHLNEVLGYDNPTAEAVAHALFYQLHSKIPDLAAVRVSETPKTWAEYRP